MATDFAAVSDASTEERVLQANDVERPPGGEVRDAAELLGTEIDVIKSFLTVMGGLALPAVMRPGHETPALLQIDAGALQIVMNDLAARCAKASDMAAELSCWGFK